MPSSWRTKDDVCTNWGGARRAPAEQGTSRSKAIPHGREMRRRILATDEPAGSPSDRDWQRGVMSWPAENLALVMALLVGWLSRSWSCSLIWLVDFRTGRLEPAIETLMRMLRRSRDAIVRALKALRSHGFLDWLRRYVPTGNEDAAPGSSRRATLVASPSARASRFLGRFGANPPPPDDHVHAEAEAVAGQKAHR